MKFKLSKFNCTEKFNNKFLVFNSLKNSFTITNFDVTLDNSISNYSDESREILLRQGILINEDVDEDDLVRKKLKSIIEENNLVLTILPTMDCQFRCAYCYEEKRHAFMSIETADAIIKYLKNIAKGKNISVFHGLVVNPC